MTDQLRSAATAEPPTAGDPAPVRLGALIVAASLAVAVFLPLAYWIAPPDKINFEGVHMPYNFSSERGAVTLLSSAFFMVAACCAIAVAVLVRHGRGRARILWALFAAAMIFFTLDEVLGFHEKVGAKLSAYVGAGPFRGLDDVIVIAYGAAALVAALFLWREVLRHPRLFPMLVISGVFFVGTTAVDTFTTHSTPTSVLIEESIKIFCSTFLMLSMLTGLVAVLRERSTSPDVRRLESPTGPGFLTLFGTVLGLMVLEAVLVPLVAEEWVRIPLNWVGGVAVGLVWVSVTRRALPASTTT